VGLIDEQLTNFEDYEWFQRARDLGARVQTHHAPSLTYYVRHGSWSRIHPSHPTDLIGVLQRSLRRRRALRPLWFLSEYPPNPGGIGTFARLMCELLASQGHGPHLLVGWGGPSRHVEAGVVVIREPLRAAFESRQPAAVLHCRRTVAALKQELKPTLYHVHLTDPSPLLHLATLAEAPAPTLLTLHNQMLGLFDGRDPGSLLSRLMVESRLITGVSTSVVMEAARARPDLAHRMVTILNGVPLGDLAPLPQEPRLLAIGRLVAQKGFDRLLRALPAVMASHPQVKLDVIGDGPDRPKLERMTLELGLQEHVQFHGFVERARVPEFLACARVVVAPSRFEGLPYALLEAAAAGRPIVASRVGGIEQVVADGQTGILVDGEAVDQQPAVLGDAIAAMLADGERARAYGTAGRERVAQHFSMASCAATYVQAYRAAMAPEMDVAVIVPAWNAGRHLAEALESALKEIHSVQASVQVLVVDDGSSDDTAAVARRFRSEGVELFQQPNGGEGMARNAGLALTNSRYVAVLDADDLWPDGRLAALLAVLEADPELEAAFGMAVEFADADAPATARWNPEPMPVRLPTTGLLRRSAFDRLGGFPGGVLHSTFAWITAALPRGLTYTSIERLVLKRRIHASNLSLRTPFLQDRSRLDQIRASLVIRRMAQGGSA
jgi:glycosyltransferase involved in cell wall biosynthesis